jgi:tetraacyldisaccharide 4'-kinase
MSFNFYLLKSFRLLLFPFSVVYAAIVIIRNRMYDWGWLKSARFNLPLICVGNISVGGTGKSPMTEYLVRLLMPNYNVATLSRGYKRKTKGYVLARSSSTALEIGDEPMQFHMKFPGLAVAVGEERLVAIPQLLHDRPDTHVIVLDDAFQHRQVNAGLNILLTDYNQPYWHDWYLPTGDLRDEKRSAQRADIIVVTKCPPQISEEDKHEIARHIKPLPHQHIYFAAIQYGAPYRMFTGETTSLTPDTEVLLVCGIANPEPLKQYIEANTAAYYQLSYPDHHIFSIDDWKEIIDRFQQITVPRKLILTTEKDAVRLMKFTEELKTQPVYVLPIHHALLFNESSLFADRVLTYIKKFN